VEPGLLFTDCVVGGPTRIELTTIPLLRGYFPLGAVDAAWPDAYDLRLGPGWNVYLGTLFENVDGQEETRKF
jgi:hypothetical protein